MRLSSVVLCICLVVLLCCFSYFGLMKVTMGSVDCDYDIYGIVWLMFVGLIWLWIGL